MANTVVVGIQWGDEGKGKIVDWLSEDFDVIARFQGGHNAGHTLVVDGRVFKFSALPSGVLRKGKLAVIGGGVVVNPWALLDEVSALTNKGVEINPGNLAVADNASLILPLHSELDQLREGKSGNRKIGTTGRGIGPAYEDKVGRRSIRVADLGDRDSLDVMLKRLLEHHNPLRSGLGATAVDEAGLRFALSEISERLLQFSRPVSEIAHEIFESGKSVLFEGAQGAMLDIDFGTYPFVTSSSTMPGGAAAGTGCGPRKLGRILGVGKAYATRVGSGPFPTEDTGMVGAHLQSAGQERGTVTGRDRRCGWFDAALARQACDRCGIDEIALTKIDVLDGLGELKIGIGYQIGGTRFDYLPTPTEMQNRAEPVYETLPGWKGKTAGARSVSELPPGAVKYIERIQQLVGRKIVHVSTSPERADTVRFSGTSVAS